MNKYPIYLTMLSLILLTVTSCPPPPQADVGYIQGKVTDINGPVADVTISLSSPVDSRTSPTLEPRLAYTTRTDSEGNFRADWMAIKTFTLTAEKAGYNTVTLNDVIVVNDKTTIENITLTKVSGP